jgi:hypothetical protein
MTEDNVEKIVQLVDDRKEITAAYDIHLSIVIVFFYFTLCDVYIFITYTTGSSSY